MTEKDTVQRPNRGTEGVAWDEDFMDGLSPAAQRRLVKLTADMIEAEVCREYNLPPGSLLGNLPDPLQALISPEEFRDKAEMAALDMNPLEGKSDDELYELWQAEKEAKNGQ